MISGRANRISSVIAILAFVTLACGLSVDLGSTPTPQPPPPPLPTWTTAPTVAPTDAPPPTVENTAAPTLTPEPAGTATQDTSQVQADVADFYGRGYLPFESGVLTVLDDLSKNSVSLNVFDLTNTHVRVQNFALWADIELNSNGSPTYPDYTGCGFAYRAQGLNEGYTAILTNDYVRMGACTDGFRACTLFGTAYGFGTGQVDVPNGQKTRFALAVNKDHAWVLVDGRLVGQYTLYTSRLLGTGDLHYAAVSNVNGGYQSACKITNVRRVAVSSALIGHSPTRPPHFARAPK